MLNALIIIVVAETFLLGWFYEKNRILRYQLEAIKQAEQECINLGV